MTETAFCKRMAWASMSVIALLVPANLMSAEWHQASESRWTGLESAGTGRAGFTALAPSVTGIHFTNRIQLERSLTNGVFLSGSGVALGDIDRDGWCDVYLCGVDSPNRLYRNLGGWRFADITARAGVICSNQPCTGAVFSDVNGDGHLDLLVSGLGFGVRLFHNTGRGEFTETTSQSGLSSQAASMSLALADIDGDNDLDLYVANFRSSSLQDEFDIPFQLSQSNGVTVITAIHGRPLTAEEAVRYSVSPNATIVEHGEVDMVYQNDGTGRFKRLSWIDGTFLNEDGKPLASPPYDWTYAAMFRDLNGDGAPDLYTCGDNESLDRIWMNQGQGRFQAIARLALRHISLSSMGVDVADINRDGLDDLFVADMLSRDHGQRQRLMTSPIPPAAPGRIDTRPQSPRNTLFLNRGDGTYAEIGQFSGVEASDWSWCPAFADVNLDGYEDLLITTGLERSSRDVDSRRLMDRQMAGASLTRHQFLELRKLMPRLEVPNVAFRNRGDLTFEESSAAWGFDSRLASHGMALGDLDNDGDTDVVVNTLNGPALVYRSDSSAPRVAVRLRGSGRNIEGIGSKIRVLGGPVPQSQEIISGGRYLSGDQAQRTFAAGQAAARLSLEIAWRSGNRQLLTNVTAGRLYEIQEPGSASSLAPPIRPSETQPWFVDASSILKHRHFEPDFDDFAREPLLPRKFSQLGPGVAWCDIDRDAREDLIMGTGRGGVLGVFLNRGDRGFVRTNAAILLGASENSRDTFLPEDTGTVLAYPSDSGTRVLFGLMNYESGGTHREAVRQIQLIPGKARTGPSIPGTHSCPGPMALADIDADGDLDLFVGGRLVPGRYPQPASSRLFRADQDAFVEDTHHQAVLDRAGLVSGAVFTDLDADGYPELVLACEWGPIRIFRNQQGRLTPVSWTVRSDPHPLCAHAASGPLDQWTGWWNSVAAGDFDGDGRMDLVAGNWGHNGRYQHYARRPLRAFFGDPHGDGWLVFVDSYEDPTLGKTVPWRTWEKLAAAMPFIQEKFPTAASFSVAGVEEFLGPQSERMQRLAVTIVESVLLLNRGDHFEARPLPFEVQWTPAFGLSVGDFDGDRHEDLFVAQNFLAVAPDSAPFDAGRSLWLRGDGHGGFQALSGLESGVIVEGEQRGCAVADYNADGRLDLVVTQNGAETKLFRNARARPGVRIRLAGPPTNKTGIGSLIRWRNSDQASPAREVRAGSGYWSQDSAVQIMAMPEGPVQLEVRWPGGRTTLSPLPPNAAEIEVSMNGDLRVVR